MSETRTIPQRIAIAAPNSVAVAALLGAMGGFAVADRHGLASIGVGVAAGTAVGLAVGVAAGTIRDDDTFASIAKGTVAVGMTGGAIGGAVLGARTQSTSRLFAGMGGAAIGTAVLGGAAILACAAVGGLRAELAK